MEPTSEFELIIINQLGNKYKVELKQRAARPLILGEREYVIRSVVRQFSPRIFWKNINQIIALQSEREIAKTVIDFVTNVLKQQVLITYYFAPQIKLITPYYIATTKSEEQSLKIIERFNSTEIPVLAVSTEMSDALLQKIKKDTFQLCLDKQVAESKFYIKIHHTLDTGPISPLTINSKDILDGKIEDCYDRFINTISGNAEWPRKG